MVWDDSVFPIDSLLLTEFLFFGYLNLDTGFDLSFIYEEYKC